MGWETMAPYPGWPPIVAATTPAPHGSRRRCRRPAAAAVAVVTAVAISTAAMLSGASMRLGAGGGASTPAVGRTGGRSLEGAAVAPLPRALPLSPPLSVLRVGAAPPLSLVDGDSSGVWRGNDTTNLSAGAGVGRSSASPLGGRPTIYDVLFAGTHDSGAYAVDVSWPARGAHPALAVAMALAPTASVAARVLGAPLGAMTRTQGTGGLGAQLAAGARFLDLRVGRLAGTPAGERADGRWFGGLGSGWGRRGATGPDAGRRPLTVDDFWLVHGMVACAPLAEALAAINAFHASSRAATPGGGGVTLVLSVTLEFLAPAEVDDLAGVLLDGLSGEVWRRGAADLREVAYEDLPPNIVSGVPGVAPLPSRWGVDTWVDTNDLPTKVAALAQQVGDAPVPPPPPTPSATTDCRRSLPPTNQHRHRHQPHRHRRYTQSYRPPHPCLVTLPPAPAPSRVAAVPPRAARDTLYVLGWTLTPSRSDVLTRLASLDTTPPPLSAAAAGMNAAFPAWAASHADAVTSAVNVVFFDYLTPVEVTAVSDAAHLGGRLPAVDVVRRVAGSDAGGGAALTRRPVW